jgi:hypothetical protein
MTFAVVPSCITRITGANSLSICIVDDEWSTSRTVSHLPNLSCLPVVLEFTKERIFYCYSVPGQRRPNSKLRVHQLTALLQVSNESYGAIILICYTPGLSMHDEAQTLYATYMDTTTTNYPICASHVSGRSSIPLRQTTKMVRLIHDSWSSYIEQYFRSPLLARSLTLGATAPSAASQDEGYLRPIH